jgi:hypothetical protein
LPEVDPNKEISSGENVLIHSIRTKNTPYIKLLLSSKKIKVKQYNKGKFFKNKIKNKK